MQIKINQKLFDRSLAIAQKRADLAAQKAAHIVQELDAVVYFGGADNVSHALTSQPLPDQALVQQHYPPLFVPNPSDDHAMVSFGRIALISDAIDHAIGF